MVKIYSTFQYFIVRFVRHSKPRLSRSSPFEEAQVTSFNDLHHKTAYTMQQPTTPHDPITAYNIHTSVCNINTLHHSTVYSIITTVYILQQSTPHTSLHHATVCTIQRSTSYSIPHPIQQSTTLHLWQLTSCKSLQHVTVTLYNSLHPTTVFIPIPVYILRLCLSYNQMYFFMQGYGEGFCVSTCILHFLFPIPLHSHQHACNIPANTNMILLAVLGL